MKIFILFACLLLCFFKTFGQVDSQVRIGGKAGINFYSLTSDNLVEDDDTGLSYEFGIYGRIGERLFVQPELNFVSHKVHLITRTQTQVGERDDLTVRFLRIPVLLGYRTNYEGIIASHFRFMLGPSISYAVSVADNNLDINRDDIHTVQFALNGGVGFELWMLNLDLLYHHYITSLLNDGRSEGKGRAFSISAGLSF